jgi:putative copper resistance protein D
VHDGLILLRLLQFAACMAVFGGAAFRFYGLAALPPPSAGPGLAVFEHWLRRLMLGAAVLGIASGLCLVPVTAAMMAGAMDAAFDAAVLGTVLFRTEFGEVWRLHLLFLLLLLPGLALPAGWRNGAVLALSLVALGSLGWVGHAAGAGGWAAVAHEINQSVHLLAAGAWLGGLIPLAWLLRRAVREQEVGFAVLAGEALPVFSRVGYVAVALIAVTGAVNTALFAGSFSALFGSGYGRLLSLKILLYVAMVGLAARNRFLLSPPLLRAPAMPASLGALYRSVVAEQALGLAILLAVSILGTWAPAATGM